MRAHLFELASSFEGFLSDALAAGDAGRLVAEGDHTTRADVAVEERFVALCRRLLPGAAVIGEETGAHGYDPRAPADIVVFVDPIDGTSLMRRGGAAFSCTFAAALHGRLVFGATYLPAEGRCVSVWRDPAAAPSDDRPRAAAARTVAPAIVGFGHAARAACPLLRSAFEREGTDVRPLGSTARSLVDLAEGRLRALVKGVGWRDGHPRLWGSAAGLVFCDAAGLSFWLDARRRMVCVGEDRVAPVLGAGEPGFAPTTLDDLYRELWRRPD